MMVKKYWLVVVLGTAVLISGFFNFMNIARGDTDSVKMAAPMGPGEEEAEEAIKEEWGRDFVSIFNKLGEMNLNENNGKFIAGIVMNALFEKPFSKEIVNRPEIISEIVKDLLSKQAHLLPETARVELLLASLAKYIPDSEFLSTDEYVVKYEYDPEKVLISLDVGEKFNNAIYVKFPNFITDETIRSFFYGMAGLLSDFELYPRNIIFDLRGCERGDAKIGMELTEYFYKIFYREARSTRDMVFFEARAQLLFNGVKRSFASCPDYEWKNIFFCSINPLFRKYIDHRAKDIFFDRDKISVKRKIVKDFGIWAGDFNGFLDSLNLFFLVDSHTSGPAEVFAALIRGYSECAVIIGEPTAGKILIKNVTKIEYFIPKIKSDDGIKQVDCGKSHSRDKNRQKPTEIGVFIWPDSYWHNPNLDEIFGLKRIDEGGITPDYIIFKTDGEEAMEQTVRDLLENKGKVRNVVPTQ